MGGIASMSVYWIGRAEQRSLEGYAEYARLRGIATDRYREIYPYTPIVRGGSYRVLEGPDPFDRHVILRFASMEAALGFYHSPEYQAAAAVRRAASGRCELVFVEGVEDAGAG
jgi:uncharacterized protein (DUF1330 family)